ncbi:MAG: hypothetical protein R3C05_13375 [Pirellulaceae bacterium]
MHNLLYRLLASEQMRLESASLISALASADADVHRQAADKLLERSTSADQPLVDELSMDSDPLVREWAVPKSPTNWCALGR